jgi:condensin complex subunit 2
VFDSVLQGLENEYPVDKLSDISTSFCFICLLHLANERGLKIEPGKDTAVAEEEERRVVANIWDLKVCFHDLWLNCLLNVC